MNIFLVVGVLLFGIVTAIVIAVCVLEIEGLG